jgi:acetyltransferase-like isoleucine patch superfamily enzyme
MSSKAHELMSRLTGYAKILMAMGFRGILKTLYLNLRLLPLSQALQLPIYCTAYTRFFSLRGSVKFEGPVRHGMVKFGFLAHNMFVPNNNITLLDIAGELHFGGCGEFAPGVSISIARGAVLKIGKEFFINSKVRIVCHERIEIGDWARIAWESQLFDTNFHFIMDLSTGNYLKKTKPIRIGNNVWIGNRTTITCGAIIPPFCIVASNSLCSKDYSLTPQDSVIGGIPAALIKTGYRRVFSYADEAVLTSQLEFAPD